MKVNKTLNMTMLCDFYELTMGNGYFVSGMKDQKMCIRDRDYMVQSVVSRMDNSQKDQIGIISKWDNKDASAPTKPSETTPQEKERAERAAFFELFWELDNTTFEEYVMQHPDVLENGWNNIKINESGLDDDGTSIRTTMGEQVLAIDAKNKILIVRVKGSGFIGALAIAKRCV